jgi:hypothetical protein
MTMSAESPGPPPSQPRRTPDFFIVGHAKSGTTALYEMLRSHPQVYMPDLKETRFFARELHPDPPGAQSSASDEHPRTLEQYLSLFDAALPEQRAGEASPSYIRSRTAAGRIAQLRPDARIVAIFREPASFLYSLHLQLLQAHVETEKDLGKAMALEDLRRTQSEASNTPIHQGLMYSEHVRYVEQLERYRAAFPSEQLLVLVYDDFRADNEGTVRRLLRFLDVDDTTAIEVLEANPTVAVRSPRLYELARSLSMGRGPGARAAKTLIKAVTPRRLRRDALAAQRRAQWGKPDPPDERLMLELRRRFKGEVVALSEYLDRDLVTLWGYDAIA